MDAVELQDGQQQRGVHDGLEVRQPHTALATQRSLGCEFFLRRRLAFNCTTDRTRRPGRVLIELHRHVVQHIQVLVWSPTYYTSKYSPVSVSFVVLVNSVTKFGICSAKTWNCLPHGNFLVIRIILLPSTSRKKRLGLKEELTFKHIDVSITSYFHVRTSPFISN